MNFGWKRILVAGMILLSSAGWVVGQASRGGSAKTPLTLDNTRWEVRVSVVKVPKFKKASGFHDVLYFRNGTVSGEALRKEGLDLSPYHFEKVKGSKTDLKWFFEHSNGVADRFEWQGTVHTRRNAFWKMQGLLTKTTPDGQIYKYRLRGSVRPYAPPAPPEFTPSGK